MSASSNKYRANFRPKRFLSQLGRLVRRAGTQTVYTALLLYYAYQRKETPRWAKRIVIGALGYLAAPVDALPDLTPIVGYTDDLGVMGIALVTIAGHITAEVRERARGKLHSWLPAAAEPDIKAVEAKL